MAKKAEAKAAVKAPKSGEEDNEESSGTCRKEEVILVCLTADPQTGRTF